jgi:flagellar protein FlbD
MQALTILKNRDLLVTGMIRLTRLDGHELVVNADLVEYLEATPDTIITLSTGRKFVVKEPVDEVIKKVIEFRRRILPIVRPEVN